MSSPLRRTLPLQIPGWPTRPTVDAMRTRLGGRAESLDGVGETVQASGQAGVVLFVSDGEVLDVYLGARVVQRLGRAQWAPYLDAVPDELAAVADAVRVFGALREGDMVEFLAGDGSAMRGELVEKCRFGALVLRDGGSIVAVGFQRLRRVAHASDN